MKNLFLVVLLAFSVSVFTSCDEDGGLRNTAFHVDMINQTNRELDIFERIDDGDFFKIAEMQPGEMVRERGFAINTDYTLEAREEGIVIDDVRFTREEDNSFEWIIQD